MITMRTYIIFKLLLLLLLLLLLYYRSSGYLNNNLLEALMPYQKIYSEGLANTTLVLVKYNNRNTKLFFDTIKIGEYRY